MLKLSAEKLVSLGSTVLPFRSAVQRVMNQRVLTSMHLSAPRPRVKAWTTGAQLRPAAFFGGQRTTMSTAAALQSPGQWHAVSVAQTVPAQKSPAAQLASQPCNTVYQLEQLLKTHGSVLLTLYDRPSSGEGPPQARTVAVIGTLHKDHATCYAAVVDVDRASVAANPIRAAAEQYATKYDKALHELGEPDLQMIQKQLEPQADAEDGSQSFRLIDLDLAFADHHQALPQLSSDAPGAMNAHSLLKPGMVVYSENSRHDEGLTTDMEDALLQKIADDPGTVTPFSGIGKATAHSDATDAFWNTTPTRESLLRSVQELATTALGEVPVPPEDEREWLQDAYRPLFDDLTDTELARLDLTGTERFMLGEMEQALFGDAARLSLERLQGSGRLESSIARERLEQAKVYVDDVASGLEGGANLETMTPEQKKTLIESFVESARQALGFNGKVVVHVEETPNPLYPRAGAMVYPGDGEYDVYFFPRATESDLLTLMGHTFQECIHVHQDELSKGAEADQEIRGSRAPGTPPNETVSGPLIPLQEKAHGKLLGAALNTVWHHPLDYPGGLEHEIEGWMGETAAKILASKLPVFQGSPAALVYRDISVETLRNQGPERILAHHAKVQLGVDMAKLAGWCGLLSAQGEKPLGEPPADPFAALTLYFDGRIGANREHPSVPSLLTDFRAQLLGSVPQVAKAAQDPKHAFHQDAKCLVAALYTALGASSPVLPTKALKTFDEVERWCRTEAASVKTEMGKSCLYQVARDRCNTIGVSLDDRAEQRLRTASGATQR